ncbi:MAG: branched-chain-amino-acid transaminase [Simkaniaceae bacterium]
MKKGLVFLQNEFYDLSRACISLFDLGLMRGYGIFDYLRTYQRIPFHLEDHLIRFETSARSIGISLPKTLKEIENIIFQMLEKVPFEECSIKLLLTGGESESGIHYEEKPTLAIAVFPFSSNFPLSKYEKGIALMGITHERPYPACKTLYYLPAVLALKKAAKKNFDDVLYVNAQGEILEASTSNFFAFKNDVLITPSEGILPGITREVVMHLAKKAYAIERRKVFFHEMPQFDEVFISASNKEIVPVVRIDNFIIGKGRVGFRTRRLMDQFKEYASNTFKKPSFFSEK